PIPYEYNVQKAICGKAPENHLYIVLRLDPAHRKIELFRDINSRQRGHDYRMVASICDQMTIPASPRFEVCLYRWIIGDHSIGIAECNPLRQLEKVRCEDAPFLSLPLDSIHIDDNFRARKKLDEGKKERTGNTQHKDHFGTLVDRDSK